MRSRSLPYPALSYSILGHDQLRQDLVGRGVGERAHLVVGAILDPDLLTWAPRELSGFSACDGVADPQPGTWKAWGERIQFSAERNQRGGPMRRAERGEGDAQLGRGDRDVAGVGERRLDERTCLVVGTTIVGRDTADEVALGLVGDHLEHVGQVPGARRRVG